MCKKMLIVCLGLGMAIGLVRPASAELVLHWTFDEGSGNTANDQVGGVKGDLINATWTGGLSPNSKSALAFNGTDAYVDVAGQDWGTFNQVSIALWLQFNSLPGAYNSIFHEDWSAGGIHFMVRSSGVVGFSLNGRGPNDYNSQAVLEAGEIYHVIATYDITTGDTQIYINGVLDSEGTSAPSASAIFLRSPFTIGSWNTSRYWDGVLDDLRIYDHIVTEEEIPDIMAGVPAELASDASPEDAVDDVLRDTVLSWTPGAYAATHNVYFGESFGEVDTATAPTTADLDVNSFDPGRLEFGQTYYWRVDEVNGAPDKTVFKGEVWSFTVEPYSIMIPIDVNKATASSSAAENPPAMTVNGSGLVGNMHSTDSDNMWLSGMPDLAPWLMFEFDGVQKLDQMKIWNSNSESEAFIGWGIKDVDIETSIDGVAWASLAAEPIQVSRAPSLPSYGEPQVIDLGLAQAKYVRLNILSNWGGFLKQYGVSEVQFYGLPVYARTPDPASGSVDVLPSAAVSWRSGREAGEHRIYMGTDVNAVADGTAPSVTTATNSLALDSLDVQLGETYYWRVDEVNDAEETTVWAGPVWNLGVIGTLVVEDFEAYGNLSPDRPFQTWLDGFGYSADEFFPVKYPGNGTGSGIGHDIWTLTSPHYDGDIMETATVINGSTQSMPLYFDGASQTDRQFAPAQDWTLGGITTLSIAVKGNPDLAGNSLYAKINGTKVTYDGDLSVPIWRPWHIDLTTLGDLSNVTTLSLGVEGNGSGMVLIDDILLHKTAPVINEPPAGADKSMVGHWALDETEGLTAADSSGYGNHGTLMGMDGTEWVAGISGGALMLDGNAQYVDFGNDTSLQLIDEVTISAWVKLEPDNTGAYMGIAGKLAGGNNGYALVRHGSNVFRMWVGNIEGSGLAGVSSDVTYNDTDWHHVVGVVGNGTGSLYVDGVKQAEEAAVRLVDSGGYAYIGRQYSDYDDRYWRGAVDDLKIFYRALSEQEISGL